MATTVVTSPRTDGWIECSFSQSAAETAQLIADPGDGARIHVKDFVATCAAAGTIQLESATDYLVPARAVAAGVPLVIPDLQCGASKVLQITSVTSAFKGRFLYKIVPS